MKTLENFIVHVPKRMNDEMTLKSGLKLFIDTRFNEFEHRINEGTVVATPMRYETGVSVGDTLYFHHLVVINDGQTLETDEKDNYLVKFSPTVATNNQAICYKSCKTGIIHLLNRWSVLAPLVEPTKKASEIIEVVELEERPVTMGVIAFDSEELKAIGVKKGDVVGFKKNHDYRFKIDGLEYYRIRVEDLMCVYEEEEV